MSRVTGALVEKVLETSPSRGYSAGGPAPAGRVAVADGALVEVKVGGFLPMIHLTDGRPERAARVNLQTQPDHKSGANRRRRTSTGVEPR